MIQYNNERHLYSHQSLSIYINILVLSLLSATRGTTIRWIAVTTTRGWTLNALYTNCSCIHVRCLTFFYYQRNQR